MNTFFTKSHPLSRYLNPDFRQQQDLPIPVIDSPMIRRHTCLCCATVLLRHIRWDGLYWHCRHCHAEMPV